MILNSSEKFIMVLANIGHVCFNTVNSTHRYCRCLLIKIYRPYCIVFLSRKCFRWKVARNKTHIFVLLKPIDCKTVHIFAYSSTREQSNKRSGTRLKTESEASHARRACEARALRARKTLTVRFTDFFTDFEKKNDCFAV